MWFTTNVSAAATSSASSDVETLLDFGGSGFKLSAHLREPLEVCFYWSLASALGVELGSVALLCVEQLTDG